VSLFILKKEGLIMIKDFEYFGPKELNEAINLLSKYKDDCKIIAGGQTLLILMRQGLVTPKYVIDIKGISSLNYINLDGGKGINIGALTTHRTIEKSPVIRDSFNVLAEMERKLATVETRSWGTIGGNLAHADPAGDVLPVLIALDALIKVTGPGGERVITAEEFARGYFETALEQDEILTEIQLPLPKPRTGTIYEKFTMIEGDYAMASVGVSIRTDVAGKNCDDIRIVLGSVAPTPIRAKGAEKVLVGKAITEDLLEEAGKAASEEAEPVSDMHASDEYKRHLVKILVKRIVPAALERAQKA
jgi:aerobic carbon-monoxide dehydrogenase medium subunit